MPEHVIEGPILHRHHDNRVDAFLELPRRHWLPPAMHCVTTSIVRTGGTVAQVFPCPTGAISAQSPAIGVPANAVTDAPGTTVACTPSCSTSYVRSSRAWDMTVATFTSLEKF